MGSWKDWKCITVEYGTDANTEIVKYLRKYCKMNKKNRGKIEQVHGDFDNFFYLQDEKIISYIILRWGRKVELLESYNEWLAWTKKERKQQRREEYECNRYRKQFTYPDFEKIKSILAEEAARTGTVQASGQSNEDSGTQTYSEAICVARRLDQEQRNNQVGQSLCDYVDFMV